MIPNLTTPPPVVWRLFAAMFWGLVLCVVVFVMIFMALFILLVAAVVIGWLASLVS